MCHLQAFHCLSPTITWLYALCTLPFSNLRDYNVLLAFSSQAEQCSSLSLCSPGKCFSPSYLGGPCSVQWGAQHRTQHCRCGLSRKMQAHLIHRPITFHWHFTQQQVKVFSTFQAQLFTCACICYDKRCSDVWQQHLSAFQYCSFLSFRLIRLSQCHALLT